MYITSLTLDNFRNYVHEKIEFSPGTNLIIGNNAQGKTNILEAVFLFSCGRSHRARQDIEMINFNASHASQEICFFSHERTFKGQMVLDKSGKKLVKINNVQINKLSKLMSYLSVVLFSPEDLSLIKGSPAVRRKFIDSAISQLYPGYLSALITYKKALSQKSMLLKELRARGIKNDANLSAWNSLIAKDAEKIRDYRIKFIEKLSEFAKNIQQEISSEDLSLEYEPNIKLSEDIFEYLENHQQREIEAASTLYGIHRDDFMVSIGGHDSRLFSSQGQQRTASLSLKIAQADYIHHIKGEYPVLLLDDIMSELDKQRRGYLWKKIKGKQVLITCTDMDDITLESDTKHFLVSSGTIKEES